MLYDSFQAEKFELHEPLPFLRSYPAHNKHNASRKQLYCTKTTQEYFWTEYNNIRVNKFQWNIFVLRIFYKVLLAFRRADRFFFHCYSSFVIFFKVMLCFPLCEINLTIINVQSRCSNSLLFLRKIEADSPEIISVRFIDRFCWKNWFCFSYTIISFGA